jgi:hypothetical protein
MERLYAFQKRPDEALRLLDAALSGSVRSRSESGKG